MTLSSKLGLLVDNKNRIKQALEAKGAEVGDAPLSQYPQIIEELKTGGASVDIGEVISIQIGSSPPVILEVDDMTFLRSGNLLVGEQENYPDVYRILGRKASNSEWDMIQIDAGFGTDDIRKVVKGPSGWLAVAGEGSLYKSDDGLNWTVERTTSWRIEDITSDQNGVWYIVGHHPSIMYGVPGNWKYSSLPAIAGHYTGVTIKDRQVLVVGTGGRYAYTGNTTAELIELGNFTDRSTSHGLGTDDLTGIFQAGSNIFITSGTSNRIARGTSSSGTWSSMTISGTDRRAKTVTLSGDTYIVLSNGPFIGKTTTLSGTITGFNLPGTPENFESNAMATSLDNGSMIVGNNGGIYISGPSWPSQNIFTRIDSSFFEGVDISSVHYTDNHFVLYGYGGKVGIMRPAYTEGSVDSIGLPIQHTVDGTRQYMRIA